MEFTNENKTNLFGEDFDTNDMIEEMIANNYYEIYGLNIATCKTEDMETMLRRLSSEYITMTDDDDEKVELKKLCDILTGCLQRRNIEEIIKNRYKETCERASEVLAQANRVLGFQMLAEQLKRPTKTTHSVKRLKKLGKMRREVSKLRRYLLSKEDVEEDVELELAQDDNVNSVNSDANDKKGNNDNSVTSAANDADMVNTLTLLNSIDTANYPITNDFGDVLNVGNVVNDDNVVEVVLQRF